MPLFKLFGCRILSFDLVLVILCTAVDYILCGMLCKTKCCRKSLESLNEWLSIFRNLLLKEKLPIAAEYSPVPMGGFCELFSSKMVGRSACGQSVFIWSIEYSSVKSFILPSRWLWKENDHIISVIDRSLSIILFNVIL